MFEKDEDYRKARKESKDRITKVIKVWSAREETLHDEGFQNGAEFGYNKANEWHYVKDGDYPKDNKPVLCILGDISEESYEVGYFSKERLCKPTEWWHFETYELPDDDGDNAWGVSAWKEIVLPELPKESE